MRHGATTPRYGPPTSPQRAAGFTLIETLIVLSIVLLLATLAIPRLLAALQRTHEAAAVGMLRVLRAEQEGYRLDEGQYAGQFADLTGFGRALAAAGATSPGGRGRGRRRGAAAAAGTTDSLVHANYIFRLSRPSPTEWNCTAEPVRARTASRFFYTDHTGALRHETGRYAGPTSPTL